MTIFCALLLFKTIYIERRMYIMPIEEKAIEVLKQEIDSLDSIDLHNLFLFYYKINHQHFNIATFDKFNEFLKSFDQNPFRRNDNITFRNQLIESLIAYTDDYMSLISAVVLIKRNFTVEEIIENYYSNINVFDNNLF